MLTTYRYEETTSLQPSLEEITKLQKRLQDAIREMEVLVSEDIRGLWDGGESRGCWSPVGAKWKSKFERLEEIKKILSIEKYKIVFIGTIGQGKTTAICHLFNLISDFKVSKKQKM